MKKLLPIALLVLAGCSTTKPLPQYSEAEKETQRQSIGYWQPDSLKTPSVISPAAQQKIKTRRHRGAAPLPLVHDDEPRPLDEPLALPPAGPQPGRSTAFWQKLNPFRSKQPATENRSEATAQKAVAVSQLPRKCKGCTFNVVAGNQSNNTVGKKATAATAEGATATVTGKKSGPAVIASDSSTLNAIEGGGNLAAVHGDGNTLPQTATTQQASDWRATLAKPAGAVLAAVLGVVLVGGIIFLIAAYRRRNKLTDNA